MPEAASFRKQSGALVSKSYSFQKQNMCSNICLIQSPIALCMIMLALQRISNVLINDTASNKCGCVCYDCCATLPNGTQVCSSTDGVCDSSQGLTCNDRSTTVCGLEYSTDNQAGYCAIPTPSNWPPILQVPREVDRAQPWQPAAVMPYTGANKAMASGIADLIFTGINEAAVLNADFSNIVVNGTVQGYKLAQLGMQFGSNDTPGYDIYTESAFREGDIFLMLQAYDCANRSMENRKFTLDQLISTYFGLTFPPSAAQPPTPPPAANAINSINLDVLAFTMECVDSPVVWYPNMTAINSLLYCGYYEARCNGSQQDEQISAAWDFLDTGASNFHVNIWYNDTFDNVPQGNPPYLLRMPALLNAVASAWLKKVTGLTAVPGLLALMDFPKAATKLDVDLSALLGPLFYTWVMQLLLPTFLQQLVYEKEKRLRMMMRMHGMGNVAYWLVTYVWYVAMYCAYLAIFIIFGSIVNLSIFRINNYGIQVILYFIFGNNVVAFAFMLSAFFSSSKTATVVAFLYVFASGLIGSLLLQNFLEQNDSWMLFVEFVPAWALFRAVWEFSTYAIKGTYANTNGLEFSNLHDDGCGMWQVWVILLVEWVIFMVLGLYFEQVVYTGNGVTRHPLFFLDFIRKPRQSNSIEDTNARKVLVLEPSDTPDVVAERERAWAITDFVQYPVVIRDLQKIYPGQDGQKAKVAVKSLSLAIERGECFGLLGPNGAGKSTSINMLVGFLEPSGGTAYIEGHDIRENMSAVYKLMGVCPQHDLLWEQLSAREHLMFYGKLKGLEAADLQNAVYGALKGVNLHLAGVPDKLSGLYSGGMKRRLSVAISFIGDPKVVYLDEPSTGLDPASRRSLWDVVQRSKKDRAIILTTHSMEEAEILCDRLGIFVDGELVCVGNPKEIKSRFAEYYVFTIMVPSGKEEAAKRVVLSISPRAKLTYEVGGTLKYELPVAEVTLGQVFATMDANKAQLEVLDWGLANATLEEVFIKLARAAGAQAND